MENILGLVSGPTTINLCCAANLWKPDFSIKFFSVQVNPESQNTTGNFSFDSSKVGGRYTEKLVLLPSSLLKKEMASKTKSSIKI